MTKVANEVEPGDIFILVAMRVKSVMTVGDSTYIEWMAGGRQIDVVGSDDHTPNIISHRCRGCGTPVVDEGWSPA
jgi:hypothetical protein